MRRVVQIVTLGFGLVVPGLFAQESAADESKLDVWKWANFVLLAGGLGYLIGKNAGPFFAARSHKLRHEMAEAEEMWKAAEVRALEVDRRVANLESEIAAFRAESRQEAESETKRMRLQTAVEIARVKEHAEHEITAAGKAARLELKRYSAQLAVELAERKVRG